MMAHQVEKGHIKNILLQESACCVKEEQCKKDDFVDVKLDMFPTAVSVDNVELKDDTWQSDNMREYKVSTSLDNIKTELSSSDLQCPMTNVNIKMEEWINDGDIKIEFNNGLLYCEDCHAHYKDYCIKCGMLVHILNKNIVCNEDNESREQLPSDILEVRESLGRLGIFALKVIPERVKFGPFTGLSGSKCSLKLKGGKFVVSEAISKYLNWMQYINPARNTSEQNMLVLQCENNIYYQSTSQILEGDELLVYFGEDNENNLNDDFEMDFIPGVEHILKDTFACTSCCLGFSSKSHLDKHKTTCPASTAEDLSIRELTQCPSCKIHMNRNEYIHHHMAYCWERKFIPPTSENQPPELNARKTRPCQTYKCEQCKFRTKYKGDLENHTNQHYEVKMFKCGTCCRRFKTKEVLRLHKTTAHVHVGAEQHFVADYRNARIKPEGSCPPVDVKRLKCSQCEFRAQYKWHLKRHTKTKHLKEYNYKCDACGYKTMTEKHLKVHTKTKHLKEFDYKCASCKYETNWKRTFEYHTQRHHRESAYGCDICDYRTNTRYQLKCHIKTKHLQEFNHRCESCAFKTNAKSSLDRHVRETHLKEFNYKCHSCAFKTNSKTRLEIHTKSIHLKEFDYGCESCEFKTNRKSYLERHVKTKHLKEFDYKCGSCTYGTNNKTLLARHIRAKHLEDFDYKCDLCEYRTNSRDHFEQHVKGKHLKQFDYKCHMCDYKSLRKRNLDGHVRAVHLKERECHYECDRCDYKANRKSHLESHVKTVHLKEFDYACQSCPYKTNVKSSLKSHVKAVHLGVFNFNCALCEYRTNRKSYFEKHTKAKHADEFDHKCDV